MTVHLIANPAAGAGRGTRRLDDVRTRLNAEVHVPASVQVAVELLEKLVASRTDRVVVLGGDGMVHLAANALAGSDTILGIVPAGTGNDAAKGLGIPSKTNAACSTALGEPRAIDLIKATEPDGTERYAVTVAIGGLAVAINERAEGMRFPKGGAKYSIATLAELPRLRSHDVVITIDGVEHEMSTNMLAVANLAYFGGGMKVAPDADAFDEKLDVVAIGPANPLKIAGLLPTIFPGRHVRNRQVTVLRGQKIQVAGDLIRVRADGEAWGELPVTLTAEPRALLVAGV